jgi:NAD(P)-dependent dehydrogenase (short-subunit alcohol dehydrogenase family)
MPSGSRTSGRRGSDRGSLSRVAATTLQAWITSTSRRSSIHRSPSYSSRLRISWRLARTRHTSGPTPSVCQREQTRQTKERITGQIPLKRVGHLDDIAAAVLHLASSESAFVVDTELVVDGETIQL